MAKTDNAHEGYELNPLARTLRQHSRAPAPPGNQQSASSLTLRQSTGLAQCCAPPSDGPVIDLLHPGVLLAQTVSCFLLMRVSDAHQQLNVTTDVGTRRTT
ncbi:hypothetical protein [Streptomyces fuscichromogenes]|uniref:Uncharacterized protein n=1 Tax=Streptomyces fuscichromogenes TaxID=1324013 RepID=A0A917X9U5_9ACTN|nr:hypothetical protein [Streptomyces fuscichromogenes]GGM98583.1 hypothetical protein GCM10011578_019530 [Streptomyces fuscichromogenes]